MAQKVIERKCLNIPCDYRGSILSLSSDENTFCAKKQQQK